MNQQDSYDGSQTLRPTQMLNTLREALAARRSAAPTRPARATEQTAVCSMRSVRSRFSSLKRLCLRRASDAAAAVN